MSRRRDDDLGDLARAAARCLLPRVADPLNAAPVDRGEARPRRRFIGVRVPTIFRR